MIGIVGRLYLLRDDLVTLWRALWHLETPLYLKAAILALAIYVISPVDLVPEFLLGLGLLDDVLIVTIVSRWIVSKLPDEVLYPVQQD